MNITVTNVLYHGSIVQWIGTDELDRIRTVNWDHRQHTVFCEDHKDITLPFEVEVLDTEDGEAIQLI